MKSEMQNFREAAREEKGWPQSPDPPPDERPEKGDGPHRHLHRPVPGGGKIRERQGGCDAQGGILEIGRCEDIFSCPALPSRETTAKYGANSERTLSRRGEWWDGGCPSYPCCSFAEGACRREVPEMAEVAPPGSTRQEICGAG